MADTAENSGREKAVTIKTVAERAGVSIATVSRVLNNPESVTEEKRVRVAEIIDELQYVPNPIARALGNNRVETIAIVIPNITNPCLSVIVYGIMDELENAGYSALIFDTQEDGDKADSFIRNLPKKLISGVVVMTECGRSGPMREVAQVTPMAVIDCPECDVPVDNFSSDDVRGMLRLVQYLVDFGHTDIGLLAGDFTTHSGPRRVRTFIDALEAESVPYKKENVVTCGWNMNGGDSAFRKLMQRETPPTAVIAASDVIAIGALGAAHTLGLQVPADVSIAGFDNSPNGAYAVPPLTTLKYPGTGLGRMAARSVLRQLEEGPKPPVRKVLPLELLERESCGPCRQKS